MRIRLAYDISQLGPLLLRTDSKHGIARVSEELLFELSKRRDIDLTAVNLCGEDLLNDSITCQLYFQAHRSSVRGTFAPSFRSQLKLTRLYQGIFSSCLEEDLSGVTTRTLSSTLKRKVRGILYRLHYRYKIDRLYPFFESESYDVFHSPFLRLPPETLTRGVPRLLTVYDLIPILTPEFVTPYQTLFMKHLLNTINIEHDWVTCISAHTKDEFCEYTGMSPERVFVTPLAASSNFHLVDDAAQVAAVRRRYGIPDGDYLLSLAAPQPRKNLAHLIGCFFRLLDEQPALNVHLVLAGSRDQGWLYDEVFFAAESSLRHRERVVFTGFVADEDLAALYSGASAFVFPSLYEGFGLPPLEAMACGTPVVSSNTTALPEVIADAGLMVDPHDSEALCQAMLDVLGNEGLRSQLRRKGLERAAQFSWEKCADLVVEVYKTAVAEKDRVLQPSRRLSRRASAAALD